MKRTSRETALQKYEDNSAAIKASKRSRYWNDPAVRLAKCASERTRYRRGHRTTTTTQRYVWHVVLTLKSCACNICTAKSGGLTTAFGRACHPTTCPNAVVWPARLCTPRICTKPFTSHAWRLNCVYSSVLCFNLIRLPYLSIYTDHFMSSHTIHLLHIGYTSMLDGSINIFTGSNLTNRFLAQPTHIHPFPPCHLYDRIGPTDF